MTKKNNKAMKVAPIFHSSAIETSKRYGIPMVEITRDIGKQMAEHLRMNSKYYKPKLPPINLRKIGKDKKGSALDIIAIMVGIFLIAIAFLVITKFWDGVDDKLRAEFNSSDTERVAISKVDSLVTGFDNLFLIILVLSVVVIVVLAALVKADPIFYFIFVLVILIALVMAAGLSNTYEKVADHGSIDATNFDVQNYVLGNFPIFILVFGLVMVIVMYVKTRLGG